MIALSKDFLLAFSNIQKSHQKKVREFFEKFQLQPQSDGINYEPIQSAKDKNFYSVRIDQAYRAVIAKPSPNVFVLMWVDHHDEAYRWAERRQLEVNPATGALQVLDMTAAPQPVVVTAAPETVTDLGLFAAVKEKHLLRLGVPGEFLPRVRSMKTDADLEQAETWLPQEAYEALYFLAAGSTVEEVFAEVQRPKDEEKAVDKSDFDKALRNDDSLRRFYIVEGTQDLAEILTAPLEQWRVFLHPKQRQLVTRRFNGPVRVLGGAGTGKTVVAMHRARYLAEQVFEGRDDRILITTFTKNLATDISQNLRKLCTDERAWARIEVEHLDGWVSRFLRTQGYRPDVVYDEGNDCWKSAVDQASADVNLPENFYRVEWENVVQPQNITNVDQYLTAPRLGRGTRLSRDTKKKVWPVFQKYRAQLNERGQKEYVDLIRDARQLIENKGLKLPYRAVIVDEAQDMSAEAFRLVRTFVQAGDNDLFIVGDAHQRIYRHRVSLGKCGIDIRGRGKKLKVNYRTTDEIRRFAVRLLEGRPIDDLDGGADDQKGYMSLTHGIAPEAKLFGTGSEEAAYLNQHIQSLVAEGSPLESICVVARTKKFVDIYMAHLDAAGVKTYKVKADAAEQRDRPGVRLATMHRVKGLEFDHVIVAGANRGIVPLEFALASADDDVTKRNAETGERALLYVALTRAKKSALITAYGEASPYMTTAGGSKA